MILLEMSYHDMTWHDMTWHDMTWHDMINCSNDILRWLQHDMTMWKGMPATFLHVTTWDDSWRHIFINVSAWSKVKINLEPWMILPGNTWMRQKQSQLSFLGSWIAIHKWNQLGLVGTMSMWMMSISYALGWSERGECSELYVPTIKEAIKRAENANACLVWCTHKLNCSWLYT